MSRDLTPALAPANAAATEADGGLIDLAPAQSARRLAGMDWSFEEARLGGDVHALHPYPAKFIPELPRRLIRLLSRPGELVVDPFSGGGTSGVEALALGRDFLGIDANPVGNAAGRAKTRQLGEDGIAALRECEAAVMAMGPEDLRNRTPSWLPSIPNLEKWYDDEVFAALGVLRDLVTEVPQPEARDLALIAFVQAAAKLSFQDSETRYVSRPREIEAIEAPRLLLAELRRVRRIAESLEVAAATARFVDGDARDPDSFPVEPDSAGLVVTSPPYPNTFDYHLYHRFRLFWLGEDPSALRRMEIGSHLRNQSIEDPIASYLEDMEKVLANCLRVLAPGRCAVLVVGDGLFKGEVFATAPALAERAEELGYDHVATIDRPLPAHRRSVTKPGRRLLEEQLLFLRKPGGPRTATAVDPNYALHPYEEDLRRRELAALGGSPRQREDGRIEVVPGPDLNRAAFVHFIRHGEGIERPTLQCRVEGALEASSRRKNSSYGGHGIHRYKGKFYPQLAKSLINLSGLEPGGSLVVDPFGGSGTVATEAALAGIDAISFDCNPAAAAIARAKTAMVGPGAGEIAATLARIRKRVEAAPAAGNSDLGQFAEEQMKELRSWFPPPALAKLDWLLEAIRTGTDGDATTVLEVLVSDLIREVSQQEPKDLRIRRRREPLRDAPVYEAFLQRAEALEGKLRAFLDAVGVPAADAHPRVEVVCADSGDPDSFGVLEGRTIDAVVSSPPYATALPYLDTDRLSLAAVFGFAPGARRGLERTMIGSREITKREQTALEQELVEAGETDLPQSTLSFLADFSAAVAADSEAGFRRRQAPAVLFRYFVAMGAVLGNLAAHVDRGAPCWLVLGDSRSTLGGKTWTIPTVDEVAAIAERAGFALQDRLPITVTREDLLNSRHAITRNEILELRLR